MEQQEQELKYYLGMLWRGKWLILLTTLITLGGVVAFTRQQTPPARSYQATATIMIEARETPLGGAATSSPVSISDRSVNTQILLMESRNVMERALAKLQSSEDGSTPSFTTAEVNALLSFITVQPIDRTNLLRVSARAPTPELAERRANAVVEAYMDYVKAERIKAIEDSLNNIRAQLQSSTQPGDLAARATVLLPRLGTELEQLVKLVEKSAQDLEQFQIRPGPSEGASSLSIEAPLIESVLADLEGISWDFQQVQARLAQQTPQGDLSALNREAPRVERLATDLDGLSRDLQRVYEGLRGAQLQDPQALRSSLSREAPRIERLVTDLTGLSEDLRTIEERLKGSQEDPAKLQTFLQLEASQLQSATLDLTSQAQQLRRIQSQGQGANSRQMFAGVASKARSTEAALRAISKEISETPSTSLDMSRKLTGIKNYVDSVAEDLKQSAAQLQPPESSTAELTEPQITSIRNQMLAHVQGLGVAASDIGRMREPGIDISAYSHLVNVEGQLRTAGAQVNTLASDLSGRLSVTSLYSSLTEILAQVEGSNQSLQATAAQMQGLGAIPGAAAGQQLANQARTQVESAALSLDIAVRQLQGLLGRGIDASTEAQLNSLAKQLEATQDKVEAVFNRLAAIAQGGDASLTDGLPVVQGRLKQSIDGLKATLDNLRAQGSAPGANQGNIAAVQAHRNAANAVLSLDIASRQLWELLSRNASPLVDVELGVLADQLTTAQTNAKEVATRLGTIAQGSDAVLADSLSVIQGQVRASTDNMMGMLSGMQRQSGAETGPATDALVQARRDASDVAIALDITSRQLQGLLAQVTDDPLLAGELGSLAQQLTAAQQSAKGVADRLNATSQDSNIVLMDSLAMIQMRLQHNADTLSVALENLQGSSPGLAASPDSNVANQIYNSTSSITLALDVASRQLTGLMASGADPLVAGELSSLVERVAAAHTRVKGAAEQLEHTMRVGRAAGAAGEVALIQSRLASSAAILRMAAEVPHELSDQPTDAALHDLVARTKDPASIGSAILLRVMEDLQRLKTTERDPLSYGQLVVAEERVRNASGRLAAISSQLNQLQGGPGAGYEQLLQLQQQLELSRLSPQETGITTVDSAVVPEASGPAKTAAFLPRVQIPLGIIGGLLLGALAVFFREQIDHTVRTQRRVRSQVGLAPLGVIPRDKKFKSNQPVASFKDPSVFSEAFRLVGTTLGNTLSNGTRCLVVTSAEAKEGKTTLSVNLAYVLAQLGHRVLLVDGNLRKPDIAQMLGLSGTDGLSTALEQERNPAEYIVEAGVFNDQPFSVLPGGRPASNPVELLASPQMRAFLQHAQQQYDVVLVDGPPAVGFAETKVLAKEADGVILVIRSGATSVDAIKESKEDLETAGIPLVGAVLNFATSDECSHLKHESYGIQHQAERTKPSR